MDDLVLNEEFLFLNKSLSKLHWNSSTLTLRYDLGKMFTHVSGKSPLNWMCSFKLVPSKEGKLSQTAS